jgi:hypothetical protein
MAGRRRPQQRWEYLELSVSYEEEVWMDSAGGRGTFAEALTRTGGAAKWFSSVLLLNGYGAAGWELAGTVAARGGTAAHFFLKRPAAAGQAPPPPAAGQVPSAGPPGGGAPPEAEAAPPTPTESAVPAPVPRRGSRRRAAPPAGDVS